MTAARAAGSAACLGLLVALGTGHACAQQIDFSKGGPIEVTAADGLEWRQNEQVVIARGNARAVRGMVTVTADRLIAHYRKKAGAAPAAGVAAPGVSPGPTPSTPTAAAPVDASGNEIYRIEAETGVNLYTPTDHAQGDHAIYDMDQAVMVMTGRGLKLTTPQDVITARDSLEYWSQKHMAVARGNAVVVTSDGRRLAGDTLVGYTSDPQANGAKPAAVTPASATPGSANADPLGASGKLQKVEVYGNVDIRTATETVRADRAVYVPDSGIARVAGHVRITRGDNQLNGNEADVNLKTGISTLLSSPGARVQGLMVPNEAQPAAPPAALPGAASPKPTPLPGPKS